MKVIIDGFCSKLCNDSGDGLAEESERSVAARKREKEKEKENERKQKLRKKEIFLLALLNPVSCPARVMLSQFPIPLLFHRDNRERKKYFAKETISIPFPRIFSAYFSNSKRPSFSIPVRSR